MGILIDHTNYHLYLKQSSQGRAGTPDGNVFFDTANDKIELIFADELATFDHTAMGGGGSDDNQLTKFDGYTLRGLYNFENQERGVDEALRQFLRASKGTYRFAGAYAFWDGNKLSTQAERDAVRGSGYIEFSDNGTTVDRIYHGVSSLVDIQASTVPYWALVTATDEASLQAATWANFARVGDINETVQVFGSTSNGDAGAGDFDYTTRTLVVRVRSWQYNTGETTSIATGITEFSGFSAGYGVGENANPANAYDIADVIGGAAISPFDTMEIEKLVVPQTETGFNEVDGDFTWVLKNPSGGTAQECAAFLDASALEDADIDTGAGTYNGKNGRVWYARNAAGKVVTKSIGGEGLFIEGLSTAEQQNVILTSDADTTKTYPFFPTIAMNVGSAAATAANAFYHLFYVDGAAAEDFDTATAVTVNDSAGSPIKGSVLADVSGTIISKSYSYDTNTQAGLSAGIDKDVVLIVEGDGDVAQAITYFTIKRDTLIPVTCAPSLDNNA